MKMTLSDLQRIIREEYRAAKNTRVLVESAQVNHKFIENIISEYNNDPTVQIPLEKISRAGIIDVVTPYIDVDDTIHFHVVYGRIVAQQDLAPEANEDGNLKPIDIGYWNECKRTWVSIDDVTRQHPTSVHTPKPR